MNSIAPVIELEMYLAAMPVLILSVASIIAMLQSVYVTIGSTKKVYVLCLVSLIAALISSATGFGRPATSFLGGSYLSGELASFGQVLILVLAITATLLMRVTSVCKDFFRGEIVALFLMIVTGMIVLVSSNEMLSLFVGLELASIGLYALVGYITPTRLSQEAAIKYFVLGAFSTGFLLFGMALLYAFSGTMVLTEIVSKVAANITHPWVKVGALFTFVGIAFKLALVPFHMWAPDAYEGAPTGVTAFMATTVKVMMIIVAIRIIAPSMTGMVGLWEPALYFTAAASMLFGNLLALVQSSMKRMLAYSSIAHSGYMAVALAALGGSGEIPLDAVLFYLLSYCFISIGAFAVLMWLESKELSNIHLDDLNGLVNKYPVPAAVLSLFMISLAGLPPTAGFMAKFFVFGAAIGDNLITLVIIGVIGSCISLYYYLRVIVRMYMYDVGEESVVQIQPVKSYVLASIVAVCALATLFMGTLPSAALNGIKKTTVALIPK